MTGSLQQCDKRCGRPRVDASIRFWLPLYGAENIRPLKNLMRRSAAAHGGGRPQRVLVARTNRGGGEA